jgi:hypothetical protein
MYYLVNVDHNNMAAHLNRSIVKCLTMCCTSSGMDESDDDMFWNDSEEDENVRSEYDKDKGTDH